MPFPLVSEDLSASASKSTSKGSASALLDEPEYESRVDAARSRPTDVAPSPKSILLVDADPESRRLARSFLESEGHRVISCGDPVRALRTFCYREKVDLLLTDLDMPYLSGIQLAREASAVRPFVPILIASSVNPGPALMGYISQRGWYFLNKPYDVPALLEEVRELLEPRDKKADRRVVQAIRPPKRVRFPYEVA
jgi:DNA-binding NtrC family response regulator